MQLENLSLQELYDLRNQIAAEVVRQESAVKAEALKKVQALMETHRLTVDDLAKKSGLKTERQPVAVKYQHPNDASLTWTGRGRKPLWVQAYLNIGGALEQLALF